MYFKHTAGFTKLIKFLLLIFVINYGLKIVIVSIYFSLISCWTVGKHRQWSKYSATRETIKAQANVSKNANMLANCVLEWTFQNMEHFLSKTLNLAIQNLFS